MADFDDFDDQDSGPDDPSERDRDDDASDMRSESEVDGEGDELVDDLDASAQFRHLSKAQIEKIPVEEQVERWRETLLPMEVDLVTELDGSNLFFINVECVICNFLLSKELPFEDDVQFLRLSHIIEQMLFSIRSSGGVFRLIFFDGMKKLFKAAFSECVWAFRQSFLFHCRTAGLDHKVFPHWYSTEWKEHLAQWRPSLFLLTDDVLELEEEEVEKAPRLKVVLQSLLLRCLSTKTHVALLRGLQRRGHRIMAFSLEPETYDALIDHNVQAFVLPVLEKQEDEEEEEEEEEDEEEEDVCAELLDFSKRAGDKVEGKALLRSFIAVRFAKGTLEMCEGQNALTCQLMELMVKVLFLQEILLRQIPVDKRCYAACEVGDWEFFADKICSALERYFSRMSDDVGALLRQELPEGLELDSCDLFDGRMYRHIFHFTVEKAQGEKGKVSAESFGFQEWIASELNLLWAEAGSQKPFFPIAMSAVMQIGGIAPPQAPAKEKPRAKPEVADIRAELCDAIMQGKEFTNITLVDPKELAPEAQAEAWKSHGWFENRVFLDDVSKAEEMEKNAGEKKMEEKMKAKAKLTAADHEFMRKFALKKRQAGLRALHRYSRSLTGSDKMHPPIIMSAEKQKEKDKDKDEDKAKKDEDKGKKDEDKGKEKEKEQPKLGKKHQELLEKRKLEEEEKIKEADRQQLGLWEQKIEALGESADLEKFEAQLLDCIIGFGRVTDSFVDLPALTGAFKTVEAQMKVLTKALKATRTALKKLQLDKLPPDAQPKARRTVIYIFCMVHEAFSTFRKDFDGKGIKLLQEVLLGIGFPKAAEVIFKRWCEHQKQVAAAEAAAAAAAQPKGGKEDKKKGKEKEKDKDKDKDDKKKGGKDKKKKDEEEEAAAPKKDEELQQFFVSKVAELFWSGVGPDEHAFQLMHMGRYMTRTVGNQKDPLMRVLFKPDKWQLDLLDIVDSGRSALVVAPTASGKTFIGYYVMDRVLRQDNEGVAVYVAPSKALVNQVSAEIYARFSSKTFPAHSKNELLGVFLKEFNSAGGVFEQGRWKNCQVLVTIPHILEMLLLSPTNQDWVKRLKWVMFDEVHCIGEQEGGSQWEHVMQCIPCPFIALSATVADPSFFHSWLQGVNKKKGLLDVECIIHTERWNDLYRYIWAEDELRPLHPFCCLMEQSVLKNGLPGDLSLTPQESVQLFLAVRDVIGKLDEWEHLAPKEYFCSWERGFITKGECREYEKELKSTFLDLLKSGKLTSEGFSKLVSSLQRPSQDTTIQKFSPPPRVEDEAVAAAPKDALDFFKMSKGNSYMQAATLFQLCRRLDQVECLPAIFFNFSRKEIEKMLRKLVQELKDQQTNKYYGTEEAAYRSKKIMERRMAEYNMKKTAYEQAQKMKASKKQEATAVRKDGEGEGRGANKSEAIDISEDMAMAEPEEPIDIADEIDMEFSFHSQKALGQWQEDIEELLATLKFKSGMKGSDIILDGLRRGIGMHHEGLGRQYREAVEVLFRRGFLRVVFATGSLALGINMPCRTTIFCGDSLELNGLMFRQMSGRAGRRGFDLLGQVVFLDMAFPKVQRLITSDLTTLTGEFTQSPTSLLRVLLQWEKTVEASSMGKTVPRSTEAIARSLAPMFSMPFFKSKTADLEIQVVYQARFSLELLHREGLVGPAGETRGMANMVAFLFDVEPANLVLNRLFSKGLLHKYLADAEKKVSKRERRTHLTVKLAAVLAWFLHRLRVPACVPKARRVRKSFPPSEGCPLLPPLPKAILEEVKAYNESVFELYQELAWVVASTRKIGDDDLKLPLSDTVFRFGWERRGAPFLKGSKFEERFIAQINRYRARSPFSALAGTGDNFSSPADLANSLRNVMHLDASSLPSVAAPTMPQDSLEDSNSWMLDFMMHGKLDCLWEDNKIGPRKAWFLVNEFKEAVKNIVTGLKVFAPQDDLVLRTCQELHKEINELHAGKPKSG